MRLRTRPAVALAATTLLVLATGCADETPHTPGSATSADGGAGNGEGGGTEDDAGTSSAPADDATDDDATDDGADDAADTSGGGLVNPGGIAGGGGGEDDEEDDAAGEGRASGPASITIGAAGDLLSHAPVIANAQANAGGDGYDFGPMFDDVRDLLSSPDLTICHMETPLSADNTNITQPRVLVFNTPHELADAVADAGYDGCDFASNHTWDQGLSGLASTQEVLRGVGLEYAGPTAEEDDPGVAHYEVDGVQVAQLAYSYTIYNSGAPTTDVPPEAPWLGDHLWPLIGAEGILEDAEQAKADGADFVVVSMHWGNEYWTDPTEEQRELAADLLESDAVDLILGTHVHVIQPCEKINDKYVIYGLGNFLSNQSPDTTGGQLRPETQEGMFAEFDLDRDEDGKVTSSMRFQPTKVDLDGHVIRLATPDQHAETYDRVVDTMHLLGENACDAEPLS